MVEKIQAVKQAILDLDLSAKKTRKQVFLNQMDQVMSWTVLVELIARYYPEGKAGRSIFSWTIMLRVHLQCSKGLLCLARNKRGLL